MGQDGQGDRAPVRGGHRRLDLPDRLVVQSLLEVRSPEPEVGRAERRVDPEGSTVLVDRLIVPPGEIEDVTKAGIEGHGDRVELEGELHLGESLLESTHGLQVVRVELVAPRIPWVERDRPLKLPLGRPPVPLVQEAYEPEGSMGLGKVVIERQGPLRRLPGLGERLCRGRELEPPDLRPRVRDPAMGEGEGAVQREGALEELDRPSEPRLGPKVPLEPPLEVEVVRVRGGLAARGRLRGRPASEPKPQRASDASRDLPLDREHIPELAFVDLGPELRLGRRVDQPDRDPDPATRFSEASFDDGADREFLRDLRDGLVGALVVHRRGPGDDGEPGDLRERGDQLLGRAVHEVVGTGDRVPDSSGAGRRGGAPSRAPSIRCPPSWPSRAETSRGISRLPRVRRGIRAAEPGPAGGSGSRRSRDGRPALPPGWSGLVGFHNLELANRSARPGT